MTTKRSAGPLGEALRAARVAVGLQQLEMAARFHVVRETVSAWESGRRSPSHEQRVFIVQQLADAPADVRARVAEALGVAAPPVRPPVSRPDAAMRARLESAVHAAADALDVPASSLRSTLAVTFLHLQRAGVPLEHAAALVSPRAKRGAKNDR